MTDRVLGLLAALCVLVFVAHRALVPLGETDLFFHLKLGDLIRERHAIPFVNLFSFTYPEQHDPDLAWGFQVLVSWLYSVGGFPAIVLCKSALITLAAALAFRASTRAGVGPGVAALAVAVALCAADQRLVERPHLVTFVGLAGLMLLLGEVRRGRTTLLWWLPAMTLVWANFHAGVFLCVIVLAIHLVCWRLTRVVVLPREQVVFVFVLTVAATVATPAGIELPRYLLWHTGLGATRIIEEFRRADPWDDPWFFIMMTLCFGGAIRLGRAQLDKIVCSLVVAALAWRSVRFVAEWAFLSTPLLALVLARLSSPFESLRWRRGGTVLVALGLLMIVGLERRSHPLSLGLAADVAPYKGIAFATEHGLRARMFHDLDVGCYLLWEGWPRYRVFQDARLPAYPDEFHRALDDTPLDAAAFDALLVRYGVDAALINLPDINMRAGSFDPATWALVFRDEDALVFARRGERHRQVIAEFELPLRVRFRFVGGSSVEPLLAPPAGSPVKVCDWQRRLAKVLVAEGQPESAVDAMLIAAAAGCLSPTEEAEVRAAYARPR